MSSLGIGFRLIDARECRGIDDNIMRLSPDRPPDALVVAEIELRPRGEVELQIGEKGASFRKTSRDLAGSAENEDFQLAPPVPSRAPE